MRSILLGLISGIVLATSAAATCGNGPALTDYLSPEEYEQLTEITSESVNGTGILWHATRGDQSLIIVGTLHISDPRHARTMAKLRPLIRRSDFVLLEATSDEEARLKDAIAHEPTFVFNPDGPTLPDQLEEEVWTQLRAAMNARGIPSPLIAKMKPWYVAMLLSVPPCAMQMMATGDGGLDKLVEQIADKNQILRGPLEDWRTLFRIFESIPEDEQLDFLRLSLTPDAQSPEAFTALLDAYFREDHATAWALSTVLAYRDTTRPSEEIAEDLKITEDLLLTSRNHKWMPEILRAAETFDQTVVAVGAAHLIGQEGILSLLAAEGFSISRIPL